MDSYPARDDPFVEEEEDDSSSSSLDWHEPPSPVLLSRRPRPSAERHEPEPPSPSPPPPPHTRGQKRPAPAPAASAPPSAPLRPPAPAHQYVSPLTQHIQPESLSLGGEWWSLVRFVREIEAACALPHQFDFDSYRLHMFPLRPEEGSELRRFLEMFGQIGFYVVWCWQRINFERRRGRGKYTLWQLIDNRSLLTNFVAMIQLHFTGSADDRGVKDPGRAGVRGREQQKKDILLSFLCATSTPTRDEQVLEAMYGQDDVRKLVHLPPRRPLTELEDRINAKHLLLKWCAQASGVNTTTAPYRLPEEKTEAEAQKTFHIKQENRNRADEIGVPTALLVDVIPISSRPPASGLLPVSQYAAKGRGDVREDRAARDALKPSTIGLVELSFAQMDVNCAQMYRQCIENLRSFSSPCSSAASEDIERRLLTRSSLLDQIFFAEYCAILNAQFRVHTHRSRLSGVVRNRVSRQWTDLQQYFQRWAASSSSSSSS